MTSLITDQHLQTDIADLLRQARTGAVRSVNVVMTVSCSEVWRRILEAEQKAKLQLFLSFLMCLDSVRSSRYE